MQYTIINGNFVPENEAMISVKDRGVKFGDGVFETLVVHGGVIYQWELHEKRLNESLVAIGIPYDTSPLRAMARELVSRNGITEAVFRITLTRGVSGRAYAPPVSPNPTLIMETFPYPERPAAPIKLHLSSWKKISRACLPIHTKTLQCLNSVLSRAEADAAGCEEALLMSEKGHVCECSAANIFWFRGDTLYTPSLESGILAGTTRSAIIRLSPYRVEQGIYSMQELLAADEMFISNVTLKAMPVGAVGWDARTWEQHPKTQEIYQRILQDIKAYADAGKAAVG